VLEGHVRPARAFKLCRTWRAIENWPVARARRQVHHGPRPPAFAFASTERMNKRSRRSLLDSSLAAARRAQRGLEELGYQRPYRMTRSKIGHAVYMTRTYRPSRANSSASSGIVIAGSAPNGVTGVIIGFERRNLDSQCRRFSFGDDRPQPIDVEFLLPYLGHACHKEIHDVVAGAEPLKRLHPLSLRRLGLRRPLENRARFTSKAISCS